MNKINNSIQAILLIILITFASTGYASDYGDNTGTLVDIGKAHYDKKEYAKALEAWQRAAKKNDLDGMFFLAECYRNGWGVKVNKNKAFEWYKKAANQGHVGAMYEYSWKFWKKGKPSQLYWLEKSAKLGYPEAMRSFGWVNEEGLGIPKNYNKAMYWYKKAAEKKQAGAMYYIGKLYEKGRGVNQDFNKALSWYNQELTNNDIKNSYITNAQHAIKRVTRKINNTQASTTTHASTVYNGKKVALIISNSAYQYSSKLNNPVNDGKLIRGKLKKLGFSVNFVTDTNKSQMINAIAKFGQRASNADSAIFYYAGHGIQDDARRNYLLPVSARIPNNIAIRSNGVDAYEVIEVLNKAKPRISLVVFDACRNNPAKAVRGNRDFGVFSYTADSEMLVSYSTKGGQYAQDGEKGGYSPFAHALANQLTHAKKTPLLSMFDKVSDQVRIATDNEQQPTRMGDARTTTYLVK